MQCRKEWGTWGRLSADRVTSHHKHAAKRKKQNPEAYLSYVRKGEGTLEIICVFVQSVNSRTNKLVRRLTDMSFSSTFLSHVLTKSARERGPKLEHQHRVTNANFDHTAGARETTAE